ncbi:MAG: beta-ketoacyl-ACP synthase II [Fimbriimonadaceae bacterium]|nr:beta-ketoacyl-ACP synthase II [Fimbriimonadaceae bacterium]QOJ11035.1 MAG: beta-ketoacyl-ACP synthase II [Chthonomonadaceae bacterium]
MTEAFRPSGRVVVTGLGAITPLGSGTDRFWPRMLKGESGVRRVARFDVSDFPTQIAAEIDDFNPEDWLDRKEARRVDRFISLAVGAATMALQDSALPTEGEIAEHIGVLVGSGIGGLTFLEEQIQRLKEGGPSKVSPFTVPYMIPDMASGMISIRHGLKGPNSCAVTACSTGANSLGDAYHIVKRGDAVAMVAGGSEAPINATGMAAFCAARAMSCRNDEPERASRPFDNDRDGFVMGECAAALILEDFEFASSRNARIYAEIVGYGMSGDAFHVTQPDSNGDGAYRSMKIALKQSGRTEDQVGYINAHGTSTPYNDRLETLAIKRLLGDHAYSTPISSTKSMIGHTLGAAGAVEALICILAMRDSVLPPTINLETPDPDCDLDYVPNQARQAKVDFALSNSFGFGGHNVTLALAKPE